MEGTKVTINSIDSPWDSIGEKLLKWSYTQRLVKI